MSEGSVEAEKGRAAREAVGMVPDGATVALGSGSTAYLAIRALGSRFPGGGGLRTVAASRRSEEVAREMALQVVPLAEVEQFDLMLDGADEVAPDLTLIKGGGGAHFREKLLARMSRELVIMVDHTKLVRRLGERSPLPVEVVPFALATVGRELGKRRLSPTVRMSSATGPEGDPLPFVTDNGNHILDCRLPADLRDPAELDRDLRSIPGVVETGLFVGMATRVFVGMPDGRVEELHPRASRGRTPLPSLLEQALAERIETSRKAASASAKPAKKPAGRKGPAARR